MADRVLSPGKSIRHHCLWCSGGKSPEVALCPAEDCALWVWRFGRRPETRALERRADGMTATQAIRCRCRDCHEWPRKDCQVPGADCDLHHIRAKSFGRKQARSTRPVGRVAAPMSTDKPRTLDAARSGRWTRLTMADDDVDLRQCGDCRLYPAGCHDWPGWPPDATESACSLFEAA